MWLVLLVILALAVSTHGIERHGQQAITAHEAIQTGGTRHDCRDGRQRWVARVGKMWAVEVWDSGTLITSFLTPSQDYIVGLLDDCYGSNNRWAHP